MTYYISLRDFLFKWYFLYWLLDSCPKQIRKYTALARGKIKLLNPWHRIRNYSMRNFFFFNFALGRDVYLTYACDLSHAYNSLQMAFSPLRYFNTQTPTITLLIYQGLMRQHRYKDEGSFTEAFSLNGELLFKYCLH